MFITDILDRWKLVKLKRELAVLLEEDTGARDGPTTADMMEGIARRNTLIVKLHLKIARIEGEPDPDDTGGFSPKLPTDFGIPTKPTSVFDPTRTRK